MALSPHSTPAAVIRPRRSPGAVYLGGGRCRFEVWAPAEDRVEVHLLAPAERVVALARGARGVHTAIADDARPGALYRYRLGGGDELPDPASRLQPRGVHGPSQVADPAFPWTDHEFRAPALADLVIYEIHVGTFTDAGTFDAVIPRLDELVRLGVTAVELMPVAQFPGQRNWGYDGVFPYAVQHSYGGPAGLKRLVDACHRRGVAVILDVVYNHLGPEGNYLARYAPYFTDRYHTPWGAALNFDGPGSDLVRDYFINQALYLLEEVHIDGFRLDAIHAIVDTTAQPFLQELTEVVHRRADALRRRAYVIGESDLNDARVITPRERGGLGMDAQWSDDFHHALHAYMTGERSGYYADFGTLADVASAYRDGYVYRGRYSVFRDRRHGNSPAMCPGERFVIAIQNHDQTGNRARGERLTTLLSPAEQRLAACALLIAPYVPLLFMGEEYGETAPFRYFTDHGDPALSRQVVRGRKREFAAFGWPERDVPDPTVPETFEASRLHHELAGEPEHRQRWLLYQRLLALRREHPALAEPARDRTEVTPHPRERALVLRRFCDEERVIAVLAFCPRASSVEIAAAPGRWRAVFDSEDPRFGGGGRQTADTLESSGSLRLALAPHACVLLSLAAGAPAEPS